MSAPAIEVVGLKAGYGKKPFIESLSFRVEAGEMAALLGPNGAGKTTLLRLLIGQHPLRAGEMRLFGRPVGHLSASERARLVALAPQDLHVPVPFTVEEVVTVGRTARLPRWRTSAPDDLRAVEAAMARMDVLALRDRPFDELSGGERQRVVIAMALAQEPKLLLLDEPTAHLDISHRLQILGLIRRLNAESGLSVLMTSHDLNLAAEFCQRLFLLDHGRLVAQGTPEETLTEPLLRLVYECDLRVRREDDGTLTVRPARTACAQ